MLCSGILGKWRSWRNLGWGEWLIPSGRIMGSLKSCWSLWEEWCRCGRCFRRWSSGRSWNWGVWKAKLTCSLEIKGIKLKLNAGVSSGLWSVDGGMEDPIDHKNICSQVSMKKKSFLVGRPPTFSDWRVWCRLICFIDDTDHLSATSLLAYFWYHLLTFFMSCCCENSKMRHARAKGAEYPELGGQGVSFIVWMLQNILPDIATILYHIVLFLLGRTQIFLHYTDLHTVRW